MTHPGDADPIPVGATTHGSQQPPAGWPPAQQPVPTAAPAGHGWAPVPPPAAAPQAPTAPAGAWLPPAQPSAPSPTAPTAPTAPGLPFGLTGGDVREALGVTARGLLPVLAGLTVLSAVVALSVAPDGHGGSLADWLRTAVVLLGLALGGRLVGSGSITEDLAGAQVDVAVRVVPLVVTAIVVALIARHSARGERRAPATGTAHLVARSVLTGLVAGGGAALLAILAATSSPYGLDLTEDVEVAGVSIGAGPLGVFVGATLLVAVVSGLARAGVSSRGSAGAPAVTRGLAVVDPSGELRTVLGVLRTAALGLIGSAVVALVLAYLYAAFLTDSLDDARLSALAGLVVLGANAVVVLVLGALGVPGVWGAQATGGGEFLDVLDDAISGGTTGSVTLFDADIAMLALLVPAAVVLGTAVRWSLRRPGTSVTAQAFKLAAGVGAVAGLAAALLVRVSVSGSASGSAEFLGEAAGSAGAHAGLSLLWAPILGAAWAVLTVWVLRLGPTLALSLPIRISRVLAGRRIDPHWSAALSGTAPAPAGTRSAGLRLAAVITGVLVLVAAVGAAVVSAINAFVFTPAAAAEVYLDAVADGDVDAVLGHLTDTPDLDGQPFLSDDVLTGDDFSPIRDVRIGDVEQSGDHATVAVSYTVDGTEVSDSISLVTGDARLGVFDTWQVAESLPVVTVYSDSTLGRVIGGADLPQGDFAALPGGYRVHAAEDPLLTSADSVFIVTTDQPSGPSLDPEVKPEALDAAREAIDERIVTCEQSTRLPLDNCPFLAGWNSSWYSDLSDVRLAITTQPEYSLEYDPYEGVLDIVTEESGELRMTGTETVTYFSLPSEQRPWDDEFPFTVDGEVSVSGDDLVVSFDE